MRKFRSLTSIIFTLMLSVVLPVPMIQAQETAPGSSAPDERAISDNDLRSFTKAYVKFEKIREEYAPKMGAAKTPQEQGIIEQEAVIEFGRALEKEGLTMQQYSALYQVVSADQQLREKVLRLIEEERARS